MPERIDVLSTGAEPGVPLALQGLWRRELLRVPAQSGVRRLDTRTRVYWLQTPHWHADLRIPADRPDFAGVQALADCDEPQLRWLLGQEGFAGLTRVEASICRWRRLIDHAESLEPDIGRLEFDAGGLDEWGVEADYYERWAPVPGADAAAWFAWGSGWTGGERHAPRCVLLRSGRWAISVRERRLDATTTRAVRAAVADGRPVGRTELIAAADCEISLAEHGPEGWLVRLSTLPWREGGLLPAPDGLSPLPPDVEE